MFSKICFSKFRNILRNTPVLESLFNKVAGLQVVKSPKVKYLETHIF